MKQKKTLYLLLPLVLGLWGYIAWQIYMALSGTGNQPQVSPSYVMPKQTESRKQVDYVLALDYKDPFLKAVKKSNSEKWEIEAPVMHSKSTAYNRQARKSAQNVNWNAFELQGVIENAGSKEKTILLTYKGRNYMLKENEEEADFRLGHLQGDSIKVIWQDTLVNYINKAGS